MKRELKPGMKIKFVGWAIIEHGAEKIGFYADKPKLAEVDMLVMGDPNSLRIKYSDLGGHTQALIHRRQVTKVFVSKGGKEPERVEAWINVYRDAQINAGVQRFYRSRENCRAAAIQGQPRRSVKLTEILEGELPISRESLLKAFAVAIGTPDAAGWITGGAIIKALGFKVSS